MRRKRPKSPKRAPVSHSPASVQTPGLRPLTLTRALLTAFAMFVASVPLAASIVSASPSGTPQQQVDGLAYFDSIARPYRSAFKTVNSVIYRQIRVTPKNRDHIGRQIAGDLKLANRRSETERVPDGWGYVAQELNQAIAATCKHCSRI